MKTLIRRLGRSTVFALALVLVSTACNRGHRKGEPAYVSAPQAILRDRVAAMKGKEKFELWKAYFGDLMEQTAQVYADGATADEAQKKVSAWLVAKYGDKFDPAFPKSVGANVAKAYSVVAQR